MTTRLEFKSEKDIDAMLAKDLNQLSIEERENIFEAMHGVDQTVEESETLIQTSLIELEQELEKIKDNKNAYNMATSGGKKKKAYVTSRKFCLMFLRAENFAIEKAAKRIVLFMEKILQYFGSDVLGRPLCHSDLQADSRDYLSKGTIQRLQGKDSTGRPVYFYHYQRSTQIEKTTLALLQSYIFVLWSLVEDDEVSQMRGVVAIAVVMGKLKRCFDQEAYLELARVQDWIPIKIQAIHLCFDNPTVGLFEPLMWLVVGRELRQRIRIHSGANMEVMYSIQSFGISADSIPMDGKGEVQYKSHQKWIERQTEKDFARRGEGASSSFNNTVETPAPNDVALWRGRVYQKHHGNVRMRNLIDEYREEYDSISKKGEKAEVAMKIVQTIKTVHKGRFLTQDPCGQWWIEVSDKEAQKKVSKAFRSSRPARNPTVPAGAEQKISQYGNKRFRLDTAPSLLPVSAKQGSESTSCCNFPFQIVVPPRQGT